MPAGPDDTTFETEAVHRARRVSEASVVWSLVASTAAIVIGVAAGSAALVVFGAVGYVDMVGSIALVHHFRHALAHDELSDQFEERSHRIVTVGLVAVGGAAVVVSTLRLLMHSSTETIAAGIVLASISLVVLAVLATIKVRVAPRVPSAALRSDGHVSAIGATQAAIVLFGTAATALWSWEWADNLAAMVVGAVAVVLGITTWRQIGDDVSPS